jgi:hypothetical protein
MKTIFDIIIVCSLRKYNIYFALMLIFCLFNDKFFNQLLPIRNDFDEVNTRSKIGNI